MFLLRKYNFNFIIILHKNQMFVSGRVMLSNPSIVSMLLFNLTSCLFYCQTFYFRKWLTLNVATQFVLLTDERWFACSFPNHSTWLHQVLRHHYDLLKAIPAKERQALLKPLLRFNKENAAAVPKVYQWKARLDHFYRMDKQFTDAAYGDAGASDSIETTNKPVLLFNKNEG